MKTTSTLALIGFVSIALPATSHANSRPNEYKLNTSSEEVWHPYLYVETGYNDNITRASESSDEESSGYVTVMPGIEFNYQPRQHRMSLLYLLDNGYYFDSSDDDYLDHYFESDNYLSFNTRNSLNLNYVYRHAHEERGTGLTEGILSSISVDEPVEFAVNRATAKYVFGRQDAKGRIEALLKYDDKTYKNFRSLSSQNGNATGSRYKDFERMTYSGKFLYRVKNSTHLSIGMRREDKEFSHSRAGVSSQDNTSDYYFVGAQWDISGKTQGQLQLGYQDKDFDSSSYDDFSGFSWDADVTWSPKEQTEIIVSTSGAAKDPDQFGGYVNEKTFAVAWKHAWRERVSSKLSWSYEDDEFEGSSNAASKRDDDINIYEFDLDYQFSRIVSFNLFARYEDQDSNIKSYQFSQSAFGIGTQIKL